MYNNAIDLAVLDWCHLFGSDKDNLHWKRIVSDIDSFRTGLFRKVDEKKWKSYREAVMNYRNKDVAHIEVRPVSNVPNMTLALEATVFYYEYVRQELSRSQYSDYSNLPPDLNEYYKKSYKQAKNIVTIAFEASSGIEEKVF